MWTHWVRYGTKTIQLAAYVAAQGRRFFPVALTLLLALPALAAPRANSVEECIVLADMALVARGLAQEGVKGKQAEKIIRHIYFVVPGRGEELLKLILWQSEKETAQPSEFARRLATVCVTGSGNLDAILGASS